MSGEQADKSNVVAKKSEVTVALPVLASGQSSVLDYLRLGKSVAETARTSGVGRTTIYRWLKSDPAFQAAYNQWQEGMEESARSRLSTLTDKAVDALEKALEGGDARTAMQLLKNMGIFKPAGERPIEPGEVERRIKLERKRRRYALDQEERKVEMDDRESRFFDREVGEMVGAEEPPPPLEKPEGKTPAETLERLKKLVLHGGRRNRSESI
jgi:transposase-like protein